MPHNTPSSKQLWRSFQQSLEHLRSTLLALDIQAMARRSGFLRRRPRKIPMVDLALALVVAGTESILSLERVAHWISLAAKTSYSKQAFHKRLRPEIEPFLGQLAVALFGSFLLPLRTGGWLTPFKRVLLHDSTAQPLPDHLASIFAGARNGRNKAKATLKIQCVADLLQGAILQLSLSGFTRNDQAAAADILALVQPGDLILRDLGYFSLEVLARLIVRRRVFSDALAKGSPLPHDARTGQTLNLARHLRRAWSLR